jgi:guanylate kinase
MLLIETLNSDTLNELNQLVQALSPQKQTLVVFSGPSGVGKGTLLTAVKTGTSTYGIGYSGEPWQHFETTISATTRLRRKDEIDGVEYHFMDLEVFESYIHNDAFLEYKSSGSGDLYGTLKKEVERIHRLNLLPVLEIETEGKKELEKLTDVYNIVNLFILPPSTFDDAKVLLLKAKIGMFMQGNPSLQNLWLALNDKNLASQVLTLYERLNTRSSETMEKRFLRLAKAVQELQDYKQYDIVLINDTIQNSAPNLRTVFECLYQHLVCNK